jgi:hypothetical protein
MDSLSLKIYKTTDPALKKSLCRVPIVRRAKQQTNSSLIDFFFIGYWQINFSIKKYNNKKK